jgi:hypothetical protein
MLIIAFFKMLMKLATLAGAVATLVKLVGLAWAAFIHLTRIFWVASVPGISLGLALGL